MRSVRDFWILWKRHTAVCLPFICTFVPRQKIPKTLPLNEGVAHSGEVFFKVANFDSNKCIYFFLRSCQNLVIQQTRFLPPSLREPSLLPWVASPSIFIVVRSDSIVSQWNFRQQTSGQNGNTRASYMKARPRLVVWNSAQIENCRKFSFNSVEESAKVSA